MIDMGVDLRCPYVHVTKHFLNTPQIRPPTEQMGRETVTQRMRRQVPRHARPSGVLLDEPPDFDTRQGPAGP